jgi:hypothetical protein
MAEMRQKTAAAAVALAVALAACGSDPLSGRRCPCVTGFHCRAGLCVANTQEVCNGEDDNGDGQIDEGLYHASAFIGPLSWVTGDFQVASYGESYLAAWAGQPGPRGGAVGVYYALLDKSGGMRLSPQKLVDLPFGSAPVAVGTSPQGFLVATALRNDPTTAVQVFAIDPQGQAGPAQPLGDFPFVLQPQPHGPGSTYGIAVGWVAGGPVVIGMNAGGCPSQSPSCALGPFLMRAGAPPVRIGTAFLNALAFGAGQVAVFDQSSPTAIRILQLDGSVSATIPLASAAAVALTFRGSELVAAWVDETDRQHPKVVLRRFDLQGNGLAPQFLLSDQTPAFIQAVAVVTAPSELAVFWGPAPSDYFFARVDPASGLVGAPEPIQGASGFPVALLALGSEYGVWFGGNAPGFASIRCYNTPPPRPDGGVDGGADGGVDGGVDGGAPMGPSCAPAADAGADVGGQILGGDGTPLAGATVVLGACGVVTDADGRLSAAGITPPYDLSVLIPGTSFAVAYLDVSTSAPSIAIPSEFTMESTSSHTANFRGTYADAPDGGTASFYFFPADYVPAHTVASGAFMVSFDWRGSADTTAEALFLERDAAGAFQRVQLFPSQTVSDGAEIDLGMLHPTAIGSHFVAAQFPPTQAAVSVSTYLEIDGALVSIADADATLHAAVPIFDASFPGDAYLVAALTYGSERIPTIIASDAVASSTNSIAFVVPERLTVLSPPDNANDVGVTPALDFTPVANATLYGAGVRPSGGGAALVLFGAAPPLRVPDLSAFGAGLAAGTKYAWSAAAFAGPPGTVDFASVTATGAVVPLGVVVPPGVVFSTSPERSFNP